MSSYLDDLILRRGIPSAAPTAPKPLTPEAPKPPPAVPKAPAPPAPAARTTSSPGALEPTQHPVQPRALTGGQRVPPEDAAPPPTVVPPRLGGPASVEIQPSRATANAVLGELAHRAAKAISTTVRALEQNTPHGRSLEPTARPLHTAPVQAISDAASSHGYGTRYYTYRRAAEAAAKPGQRLGFAPGKGYYLFYPVTAAAVPPLPSPTGGSTRTLFASTTEGRPAESFPHVAGPGLPPVHELKQLSQAASTHLAATQPTPAHSPAFHRVISTPVPRCVVCAHDFCAISTGHVELSSPSPSLLVSKPILASGRPPSRHWTPGGDVLTFTTSRGAQVHDPTLYAMLSSGIPQQRGVWADIWHLRSNGKGMPFNTKGLTASVHTKNGHPAFIEPSGARVDIVNVTPGTFPPTYRVTASATLHLPDRTSVVETAVIFVKVVRNTATVRPKEGERKQETPARDVDEPGFPLSQIAAWEMARSLPLNSPPDSGGEKMDDSDLPSQDSFPR